MHTLGYRDHIQSRLDTQPCDQTGRRCPDTILPGRERATYLSVLLGCRILRLDAHPVVDGESQFLLATEVTFGRLDGDVSKQKLDLIQFAARKMAEPRAAPPRIMQRKFVNSARVAAARTTSRNALGVIPVPQLDLSC
jgi:hypothetical protein